MKNFYRAIVTLMIMFTLCFSAYAADGGLSLEDLQLQSQQVEETQAETRESNEAVNEIAGSYIDILQNQRFDGNDKKIAAVGSIMATWSSKIMQFLGYVISIGLALMTVIDLVYIAITPFRGLLNPNYTSPSPDVGQSGGMNGGGYGMGDMPTPFNRNNGMGKQPAPNTNRGGRCLVSEAAIKSVNMAAQANPYKLYFKEQVVACIAAPLIFVLAATGALARIGFMVGNIVSIWLRSLSF